MGLPPRGLLLRGGPCGSGSADVPLPVEKLEPMPVQFFLASLIDGSSRLLLMRNGTEFFP